MLKHQPVMVEEVIFYLQPKANQNFIDCTVGTGGHAEEILKRTGPKGKLIGLDLDPEAIKAVKSRLKKYQRRILILNKNYKNLKQIFNENRIFNQCHGLLLDLGVSSAQLADQTRGFSFQSQGEILMNFGDDYQFLAKDILANWSAKQLTKLFQEYGGEKYARQIAYEIIKLRQKQKNITVAQLSDLILQVYKNKPKGRIHPATKVFQALRIAVNDELNNLKNVLPQTIEIVNRGGRIVVISFHSLEDRIIKEFFRQESRDCLCPPSFPVCQCHHQASLKIITKKPITPSQKEIFANRRARSAQLRVAEKI